MGQLPVGVLELKKKEERQKEKMLFKYKQNIVYYNPPLLKKTFYDHSKSILIINIVKSAEEVWERKRCENILYCSGENLIDNNTPIYTVGKNTKIIEQV